MSGDAARASAIGEELNRQSPCGHANPIAVAARYACTAGAGTKEPERRDRRAARGAARDRVRADCLCSQPLLPVPHLYPGSRLIWPRGRERRLRRSFRRSWITAELSGTAGQERSRTLALPGRMRLRRTGSRGADADVARRRSLAAYKDFLTLWKDAEPDVPILQQAKAEYAKLQ